MKKITILLLSISLFFEACNQGNTTPNTPSNPPLNSTEQQLVGTWKLQRQVTIASSSTVYDSVFSTPGIYYVTFKSTFTNIVGGIPTTDSKDIIDHASLMQPNVPPSQRGLFTGNWYWNVSNINYQLFIGLSTFSSYNIDTITTNKLVLSSGMSGVTTQLWFVK